MTNYPVVNNADDYYYNSNTGNVTGTNTLFATKNNVVVPNYQETIYLKIDTSGIGTDEISSATLYFYIHGYTFSGRPAPARTFFAVIDGTYNIGSGTHVSNGWYSLALDSTAIGYINKTGTTDIYLAVQDPSRGYARSMEVRAKEYTGDYEAYLEVKHVPASSGQVIKIINS
jgi:hypothetical protein